MKSILIFGGSFDPPHLGHFNTALAVQNTFHFETIYFLPCKTSVLKKPSQAGMEHRFKMLQLMLNDHPEFKISTLELDRDSPSYMTETLQQIRQTVDYSCSVTLLLGMDAFLGLEQWHEYKTLPSLCHLLVIQRPGFTPHTVPEPLAHLFQGPCQNAHELLNHPNGIFAYFNAGNYPISSTDIRAKIHIGKDVSDSIPKAVDAYIKHHELYR